MIITCQFRSIDSKRKWSDNENKKSIWEYREYEGVFELEVGWYKEEKHSVRSWNLTKILRVGGNLKTC